MENGGARTKRAKGAAPKTGAGLKRDSPTGF
jgi:hypothetical protein